MTLHPVEVKICGLSTPEALAAAIEAGARFVGFVFFPPSPRHVSFDIAWNLARAVPTGVRSVGLFVDPSDEELERILTGIQLDMIQLHGDESPGRVAEIKDKYKMPVIKAIKVRDATSLASVEGYEAAADWLLIDAAEGGSGKTFDWTLLEERRFNKPWMLSGGLTQNNVNDAVSLLHPMAVDVSSGVESERGVKDVGKIRNFIKAVKTND